MFAAAVFALAASLATSTAHGATRGRLNDRPIIGVLTEPTSPSQKVFGDAYIPEDYVQWLEAAGARVAPVHFGWSDAQLTEAWGAVNGVLTVGGSAAITMDTQYNHAMQLLLNLTVHAAASGETVPVWGTCLGLELLFTITSRDDAVLSRFDAENISLALQFTEAAASSALFAQAPASVMETLQSAAHNSTINWHHFGVSPAALSASPALAAFWSVLALNEDRTGATFVSVAEGLGAPVWAVQFHPERNAFDFQQAGEPLDHSQAAVAASAYFANFFVGRARMNAHRFPSAAAEEAALITTYTPVLRPGGDPFYERVYFFGSS
jgi:gamma-glutamyl hydrolase